MTPSSPIPSWPARSTPGDPFRGLWLPVRAARLILHTPKLLRLSLGCAAVTGLTLVAVAGGAWSLGQHSASALLTAQSGWQRWASEGLGVVFFLVYFVIGALTAPNLLLAPLQDPLSEATEEVCGQFVSPPFSVGTAVRGTLESVRHTLLRLGMMALGLALLFPLNLVPVVGNVLWVLLSTVWSTFWLAAEHLGNPMARHFHPFREVLGALTARLPLTLGFGAALAVLLWVPVLNFFLMPIAVVAGTLLYRGLAHCGALEKSQ